MTTWTAEDLRALGVAHARDALSDSLAALKDCRGWMRAVGINDNSGTALAVAVGKVQDVIDLLEKEEPIT